MNRVKDNSGEKKSEKLDRAHSTPESDANKKDASLEKNSSGEVPNSPEDSSAAPHFDTAQRGNEMNTGVEMPTSSSDNSSFQTDSVPKK